MGRSLTRPSRRVSGTSSCTFLRTPVPKGLYSGSKCVSMAILSWPWHLNGTKIFAELWPKGWTVLGGCQGSGLTKNLPLVVPRAVTMTSNTFRDFRTLCWHPTIGWLITFLVSLHPSLRMLGHFCMGSVDRGSRPSSVCSFIWSMSTSHITLSLSFSSVNNLRACLHWIWCSHFLWSSLHALPLAPSEPIMCNEMRPYVCTSFHNFFSFYVSIPSYDVLHVCTLAYVANSMVNRVFTVKLGVPRGEFNVLLIWSGSTFCVSDRYPKQAIAKHHQCPRAYLLWSVLQVAVLHVQFGGKCLSILYMHVFLIVVQVIYGQKMSYQVFFLVDSLSFRGVWMDAVWSQPPR